MRRLAAVPAAPPPRSVDALIAEREELIRLRAELPERIRALQAEIDSRSHPADRFNVPLSTRQSEVLQLLRMDLSNKEIGWRLNIVERTVKYHVSRLLVKFGGLKNRQELKNI